MIGAMRRMIYRLRGRTRFSRLDELLALQRLPEEVLRERQFAMLSSLLKHAHASVPFYRARFEALGLGPEDIRSFEDYARLPVLTRQDVENNLESLVSTQADRSRMYLNASGGTTGKPVRFYQDISIKEETAANGLLSLSFAGWTPADMLISVWGNPRDSLDNSIPGGIRPWLAGNLVLNGFHYDRNAMLQWLNVIARYKRVFLFGYVTVLSEFAELVLAHGPRPANVCGIVTTAERLHEHQRALLSEAFGCKVHDQYGSREVPGVASECSEGNMHLFTHSSYAEFLPVEREGEPSLAEPPADEPRRLILTGLTNYAMPLLRYEIGDFGASKAGSCSCGRGFPLMRMDIGRIGGSLLRKDGSRIYSSVFVHKVFAIDGIEAFQFRQTSIDEVQLYIVRGGRFDEAGNTALQALLEEFPKDLCPGVALRLHYVDDVPKTPAGKHRHVVCEVN